MSSRINIKKVWQDICDTIESAPRLEMVQEAIQSVRIELSEYQEDEGSLLAEQRDLTRHPGRGPGARLQLAGLLLLALVLLVADVPVQFALNASSMPQIPSWIWALTAPAFAAGLAALVHGAAVAFLYDNARPARSIRICRSLAWLTFVAVVLAGGVILFARVASPSTVPYVVDLASISMWVLAEALPTSAGLFLAWAHFLSVPQREARRLRKIRQRKTRLERFLDQLTVEESTLSLAEETTDSGSRRPSVPVGQVVGGVVVLLLAWATPVLGQVCGLASDRTISQGLEDRAHAADLVYASLDRLVRQFDCSEFVVVTFTDEGRWAPRRWLRVPQPTREVDCTATRPPSLRGSKQLLTAFAGFRAHFAQEGARTCLARQARDRERFEKEWNSFAPAVRTALTEALVSHETKTDIADVIQSLLDLGVGTVVVVTDGLDTTHDGAPSLSLPAGGHVILVLVPARPEYGGREATDSAAELWEAIGPNVIAIPYTDLVSPSVWARLTSEGREP